MKITEITTSCGTRLHDREDQWLTDRYRSIKADIAVVSIHTDEGIVGIGEACAYGNPLQIADWVQWYAPSVIGKELDDLSIVPHPTGTSFARPVVSASDYAVAGIDCALWDARAKAAGQPVSRLISPDADETVTVYASGGVRYDWSSRPESLVDDICGYVNRGYKIVKFRIGTAWAWDDVTPERFLSLVDLVRAEVGDGIQLAVDGNARLTREQAREVAFGLQDRGAMFLEEPLPKADLEGYAALNAAVEMPITGGETFTTREQFRPWLEAGAFDIVQPDAGVCGLTELLAIGRDAERFGVQLVPHSWHNGLMAMANAHGVAALPNGLMLEESQVQGPLTWDVIAGGTRVRDGQIRLGDAPGFGVDVIDDLEERYPYVEGHYGVEVFRR